MISQSPMLSTSAFSACWLRLCHPLDNVTHLRLKPHFLKLLLCLHEPQRGTPLKAIHWILHSHGEEIPRRVKAQCKATASKTVLKLPAPFGHTALITQARTLLHRNGGDKSGIEGRLTS